MGDVEKGKKVYMQRCSVCHAVIKGGKVKNGPSLFGVYNKKAGTSDYSYSDVIKNSGVSWNSSALDEFLTNPKKFLPGTRMIFAGMKSKDDRLHIIEFLKTLK